jgi:hypothetical protein
MTRQRRYWLEKVEVQAAAIAGLLAVQALCWPAVKGTDPGAAVAFLATRQFGGLAVFAAALLVATALCAAVTAAGRPSGALTTALIAMGAVSLDSGQIRTLLWRHMSAPADVFRGLLGETVVLAGVVLLCDLLAGAVRGMLHRIAPGWAWRDPIAELPPEQRRSSGKAGLSSAASLPGASEAFLWSLIRRALGGADKRPSSQRPARREALANAGSALAISAFLSAALLATFLRSPARMQIVFALFASFALAVFIAHQISPTPYAALAWLLPLAVGVACYALAAAGAVSQPPQGWIATPLYARPLPIDWLSAGSGGAMFGYWLSSRFHENRYFESREEV